MAFLKRGFKVFSDNTLTDSCNSGQTEYDVISDGCADEISLQLISILAVNMYVNVFCVFSQDF
jgi:hypothetical protein